MTAAINYYRCFFRGVFKPQKSWNKINIPTLIVWSENDIYLGKELTYETDDYVQNLTIKYIPNCSHWVQQEQPELVNQYIADFLDIS
ncbi:MAG: alpha/beta fold hydrolase [Crocosphaera sp.]